MKDLFDRVQLAEDSNQSQCVLKIFHRGDQELAVLRKLLAKPSANNHTIPAELIECKHTVVAMMPCLQGVHEISHWSSVEDILECAEQIIEVIPCRFFF